MAQHSGGRASGMTKGGTKQAPPGGMPSQSGGKGASDVQRAHGKWASSAQGGKVSHSSN